MYKVPFVNYPMHYHLIWEDVVGAITESLSKGDLILRSQLNEFENNIADFIGVKYAIGVNSGTDAIFLSLKANEIGPDDEVITVAHTFVATVASIIYCGARPVLVDVGNDMNIDTTLIEDAITPKTRAIIPVHLNGRMCDMKQLMEIAAEYDLIVIEDAAQSLGAEFGNKKAGSIGLTGCFSFYPAKMLGAAGDGGLITTNDKLIAEKLRLLRDHGYQRSTGDILLYGYNSRLDNIQAMILNAKLAHFPKWIERRREIAGIYDSKMLELSEVILPPNPQTNDHFYDVYQNYVIRVKEDRDELFGYLIDKGVEVLISWPKPLHHHSALGLNHFQLPITDQMSREVLSLPMYPELSDDQVEYVANSIFSFYDR